MSNGRTITGWVASVLMAAGFALAAIGKLTGAAAPMFESWGYPSWFMTLTGVLEGLGAIGILIPKTARWAILGLAGLMVGAAFTHLTNGEASQVVRPLGFMVVLAIAWWGRSAPSGG